MKKVLLVLEDYNEITQWETFFRKFGMDVISLMKESAISETLLGFRPDMVFATAMGTKVDGTKVCQQIKREVRGAKVVLMGRENQLPPKSFLDAASVDAVLKAPVSPKRMIEVVAQVAEMDPDQLLEKYELMKEGAEGSGLSEMQIVSGKGGAKQGINIVKGDVAERKKTYDEYVGKLPEPKADGFPKDKVAAQRREFRKAERDPEIEKIDEERKAFVKALVKKD